MRDKVKKIPNSHSILKLCFHMFFSAFPEIFVWKQPLSRWTSSIPHLSWVIILHHLKLPQQLHLCSCTFDRKPYGWPIFKIWSYFSITQLYISICAFSSINLSWQAKCTRSWIPVRQARDMVRWCQIKLCQYSFWPSISQRNQNKLKLRQKNSTVLQYLIWRLERTEEVGIWNLVSHTISCLPLPDIRGMLRSNSKYHSRSASPYLFFFTPYTIQHIHVISLSSLYLLGRYTQYTQHKKPFHRT